MNDPSKKAAAGAISAVPLLDLKAQYATLREPIEQAIREVCEEQRFILGPKVTGLEEQIAAYSGVGHGIGVSSGTDALLVALMAFDIGSGDAVITSPYTFFATGGVIARLGAQPIFCDIDPVTYNLCPDAVEKWISESGDASDGVLKDRNTGARVRMIMPVHLFGQVADMGRLSEIARAHGLAVVEDAAQAIGSRDATGASAGSTGDIGCFSFFPSKNLGAFGDGGMCITDSDELAEKLKILRVHGGKPKYFHSIVGGNFRLDSIHAAVLQVKLPHLDSWTEKRQQNAAYYDRAFSDAGIDHLVKTPTIVPGNHHIFNQYVIRVPKRDELREFLSARNIGNEVYYPVPLHIQKCFADLGYVAGDCPESERAAAESLAIPIYPELTEDHLAYVVSSIADFLT